MNLLFITSVRVARCWSNSNGGEEKQTHWSDKQTISWPPAAVAVVPGKFVVNIASYIIKWWILNVKYDAWYIEWLLIVQMDFM